LKELVVNGAVLLGLVFLAVVALVGVGLTVAADGLQLPGWADRPRRRVRVIIETSIEMIGRPFTALFVAAAGLMLLIFTLWVLGVIAHHTQNQVDWPAFRYFRDRQIGGSWQNFWNHATKMGNRPETQALTVVAALVMTGAWLVRRRPNWWAPLFGLPIAYLMEKYGGIILKKVVNRGHPPTTLGTWVSGGCARLLIVYGLVMLLTLRVTKASRRWQVAGFSLVGFLAAVEAYSRTYLLKHWITDVVGGLLFGIGLLLIAGAAFSILDGPGRRPSGPPDGADVTVGEPVPAGRAAAGRAAAHR
jgi:membrane-associated phospholipid phosphatase